MMERRKEIRIPMQIPVDFLESGGEACGCLNHDISPKGMSLSWKEPLELGRRCRLMFALPDHQERTEVSGEVRWHSQPAEGRIGIEFSEPVDLSIPFAVADQAMRNHRQATDSHIARLCETLGDACVWVDLSGEIIQCDERFVSLMGYSDEQVKGCAFSELARTDDRDRLANLLLASDSAGIPSQGTGLFRMQPKDGPAFFWRIRVFPKTPWATSKEVWIEDLTQSCGPVGTYPGKEERKLRHLPHILEASATGFVFKEVIKEACDPFTGLLGRLDLLRYRLALDSKESEQADGNRFFYYMGEVERVEKLVEDLSKKFKCVLENTFSFNLARISHFDVNQSLSTAIAIAGSYEGFGSDTIRFESRSVLPMLKSNEQEYIMIFLVFLLLSRDCLKNVTDRTIRCETQTDGGHIVCRISHNGSIRKDKCLDIILDSNPVGNYFFQSDSICFMDTLLYYGNLLMKKNGVKTKINNIPGQFSLSFLIPTIGHPNLEKKPQERRG